MHVEWLAHVAPAEAVAEVAAAARGVVAATDRLDDAAIRARLAGASWGAIGAAAGITRQAAHLRWYNRTLPILIVDLDAGSAPIVERFMPGARVRRTDSGRTGTVDPDAVSPEVREVREEHPDLVPVRYDRDDAALTSQQVLVELRDETSEQP
ncbi:hypothetical protein IF650_19635 [Cellulosimicrobium terreum]|nr:hypothetical protein [Cellulosimicrobium terreum]